MKIVAFVAQFISTIKRGLMNWQSCCGLLFSLVAVSHAGADEEALKKDVASLQGVWTVTSMEIDGRSLLEKDKPEPALVIKDGKLTSESPKAPRDGLELSKLLDPSRKPKSVTVPIEGKVVFYGIYEIDGDTLRVCGDGVDTAMEKDVEGRRPKEFDSKKGMLIVFKRKKS